MSTCFVQCHHLRDLRYYEQLTGGNWIIELWHVLVEGKKTVASTQAEERMALTTGKVTDLLNSYDQQMQ